MYFTVMSLFHVFHVFHWYSALKNASSPYTNSSNGYGKDGNDPSSRCTSSVLITHDGWILGSQRQMPSYQLPLTSSDVANGMLWLHSKLLQIVGRLKTSLIRQVPVQRKWLQLLYWILPGLRIPTEKLSWTWGRWPSHSCTDPRQTDLTNHQYWWPVLIERGKCWPWEEYSCPKRPLLANWTQNHNQTLQSLSAEASHI